MRISDWSSDVCSSDLDVAAMQLHRHLADSQVEGDLLVDPAARHLVQDLALARRQRRQSPGSTPYYLGFGPSGGVQFDRCQPGVRSEEHTSELQSLMRISYAVFCLQKTTYVEPRQDPDP